MMLRNRYSSFVMALMLLLPVGAMEQGFAWEASSGNAQDKTGQFSATDSKKSTAPPKPAAKPPPARRTQRPARVPIRQARPTWDRYREIQQALADAGYYEDAVDGVWGDRSEAALKEFQRDNDLEATGNITALTLIRLGLGPKYDPPEEEASTAKPPG